MRAPVKSKPAGGSKTLPPSFSKRAGEAPGIHRYVETEPFANVKVHASAPSPKVVKVIVFEPCMYTRLSEVPVRV